MKNIESPENINERRVSISFLVELPRLSQTPPTPPRTSGTYEKDVLSYGMLCYIFSAFFIFVTIMTYW
jgi:hypothetical protein